MGLGSIIQKTFAGAALYTLLAVGANAVLPYTLEAGVTPEKGISQKKPESTYCGIVLASTKNETYAKINAARLMSMGYDNVSIQEVMKNNEKFYRTIVGPQEHMGLETILARVKEENPLGNNDFFMLVNEQRQEEKEEEKPRQAQEKIKVSKKETKETHRKEKKAPEKKIIPAKAKKETVRTVSFDPGLDRTLDNMPINQYLSLIAPYIETAYRTNTGKSMEPGRSTKLARYFYRDAKAEGVPVLAYIAHIATESNFKNVKGDLNLGTNYSEGLIQMRKLTQKDVFNWMRKAGKGYLPAELPESILDDESLQSRMGAFYFKKCWIAAGGNSRLATSMYNAGTGNHYIQEKYVSKVEKRKLEMVNLITQPADKAYIKK